VNNRTHSTGLLKVGAQVTLGYVICHNRQG
jgi:hypothetical protein